MIPRTSFAYYLFISDCIGFEFVHFYSVSPSAFTFLLETAFTTFFQVSVDNYHRDVPLVKLIHNWGYLHSNSADIETISIFAHLTFLY